MFPKNYRRPIARVDEQPLDVRFANARADLEDISRRAEQQQQVHEYAKAASAEVVRANRIILPYDEALSELFRRFNKPVDDEAVGVSSDHVVNALISPGTQQALPDKTVVRDLAHALHPDAKGPDEQPSSEAANLYKAISSARTAADKITIRHQYARILTSGTPEESIAELELRRYKAWLALHDGKGKFASEQEVDAWKAIKLENAPFAGRMMSVMIANQMLLVSLDYDEETASIAAPAGICRAVADLQLSLQGKMQKALGDQPATFNSSFEDFDTRFGALVEQLGGLLEESQDDPGWTQGRFNKVNRFINSLSYACDTLDRPPISFSLDDLGFGAMKRAVQIRRSPYFGYGEERIPPYKERPNW